MIREYIESQGEKTREKEFPGKVAVKISTDEPGELLTVSYRDGKETGRDVVIEFSNPKLTHRCTHDILFSRSTGISVVYSGEQGEN